MKFRLRQSKPSTDLTSQSVNLPTESSSSNVQSSDNRETVTISASSAPIGKRILGSLMLLGIVATFFVLTKGSHFCLLSSCPVNPISSPIAGDFWSFAGGTATLFVLTTFLGVPLLSAAATSTVIWLLMNMSLR